MTEELAIYKENSVSTGNEMYFDVGQFEQAQRVAKMLASSTMVPDHFRNNVGNCMIGLNFASRVGLDPFMVLQKMFVIHGRPGIEGQLAIALINRAGRFTPLKFKFSGCGDNEQCTCYATEISTGEVCEQTVTWEMVKAEGWDKKPGSKWKTLRQLMFQYRSAAFFGRLYCPEALLGMMTQEELHDIHEPVKNITSIADRLKKSNDEQLNLVDQKVTFNPLHETPEWAKYKEACEIDQEISGGFPEPTTTEDCLKAIDAINSAMDEQNA